jgi:type I restriction enzyme S subunit
MGGRYRAYPELKHSEVEWVGDIPKDWDVKPLFGVAETESIKNEDGSETNVLSLSYGNIIRRDVDKNFGLLPESFNTYQLVNAGELILRLTDLQNDKRSLRVGHAKEKGIITSAYLKLRARKGSLNDKFLYRLLHSYDTTKVYYGMGGGLRQSMKFEEMRRLPILVPPLSEQETIANFLDHETDKIDTLIEKQQQLIKLLKEKRQAVISHAVTKGLNPDVPMRDSGVEWLGEVPEQWSVTKVGWMCEFISYGFTNPMPSTDEGPFMLTATDIEFGRVKYEEARRTSVEAYETLLSPKSKPEQGDILLTKDGTLGRVTVFDGEHDACISQSVALLRIDKRKVLPEFLSMALMGADYQSKMIFDAGGTTIKHIYISILAKMNFILPEMAEQKEILKSLSAKLSKMDSLIEQAQNASSLLSERRTALISAAVTGKIDVRSWQPPEPQANKEAAA